MAYVAFDTSKLHNAVALAEAGRAGEVRYLVSWRIPRRRPRSWCAS